MSPPIPTFQIRAFSEGNVPETKARLEQQGLAPSLPRLRQALGCP